MKSWMGRLEVEKLLARLALSHIVVGFTLRQVG